MTERIGQWVHRRGTRSHLVESEIADRVVTRCGRQMEIHLRHPIDERLWDPADDLEFGDSPTWSGGACVRCAA